MQPHLLLICRETRFGFLPFDARSRHTLGFAPDLLSQNLWLWSQESELLTPNPRLSVAAGSAPLNYGRLLVKARVAVGSRRSQEETREDPEDRFTGEGLQGNSVWKSRGWEVVSGVLWRGQILWLDREWGWGIDGLGCQNQGLRIK